jgi:hypothetical protein
MQVFLDEQPVVLASPPLTIAAALHAARCSAESRGRVVVEVAVDGRTLDGLALAAPPDTASPTAELRCRSADPRALVAASFRDAAEGLLDAITDQDAAADAIARGRFDLAMPRLTAAVAAWTTARQVLDQGAALLAIDLNILTVALDGAETPVARAVAGLAAALTELRRCLTAQDWCGLGDVLAYDLCDQGEVWRRTFTALADRHGEPG